MYDAGVAINGLACFMTADLARDLANDIITLVRLSQFQSKLYWPRLQWVYDLLPVVASSCESLMFVVFFADVIDTTLYQKESRASHV